jgi:glycosyltransferase involved in cell wall biosynthesis
VRLTVKSNLADGWQESIAARARFILETSGNKPNPDLNWFDLLKVLAAINNGSFFVWLAVTGCYPDKFEYQEFLSQISLHGLRQATQNLLKKRSESLDTARKLAAVQLVTPQFSNLVDVTHTSVNPFLTGIQRVVFGVTDGATNISTFVWMGDSGIMEEQPIRKMESAQEISQVLGWRIRLVHFLHAQVPKLERTRTGTQLRNTLLPLARNIKYRLVEIDIDKKLLGIDDKKLTNVLILNSVITIPEITANLRQIYLYESILENEIVPVQIILYDFIPFFHAWTVHLENRAQLSSYVRLVLLATRIVSISSLVHEQAKLITQAFKLERQEWSSRAQSYSFLELPSGLKPTYSGEFEKQENLVVMAGSLEPRKNHLQFLSAIEALAKDDMRVKARILGSAGWNNERILEKIHDLQKQGVDIERIGNISDLEMRKLIAQAQVLLQISEAEGFGLPIAEALALGTKVIVSNVRPLNEWKSERVSIVEIGNIEQLKNQLLNVLNNPEKEGVMSPAQVTWEDWHQLLFGKKSTF